MLSVYLSKRLFPNKHFLANSTAFDQSQIAFAHSLLRCFENYLYVNCYSTTSSLVNADLLTNKRKKSVEQLDEEKSFTVSYFMNSHGFSRERAISISARIHFKDSQKPNSVYSLLKSYEFNDTQIASVVRIKPRILMVKENTILPKLDFLLSIGMSKLVLAKFISTNPTWLTESLDNYIIPNYNFLKTFLLSDERVIYAITKHPRPYNMNVDKRFAPNVKVLIELKVPQTCISLLLLHFPAALVVTSDEFQVSVSKVLEIGFDPLKSSFVMALRVLTGKCNKATWDQCCETYSNWGWSEEDIYTAFRKQPYCMLVSRNKIDGVMDFLVNKIGLNSRYIAENPYALNCSVEKKIIPRFSVVQVLLSKGLIKRYMMNTVLIPPEKCFLDKFVVPYNEELPKLYDCYKGKVAVEDMCMRSEQIW